jgi:hypothetical protein
MLVQKNRTQTKEDSCTGQDGPKRAAMSMNTALDDRPLMWMKLDWARGSQRVEDLMGQAAGLENEGHSQT